LQWCKDVNANQKNATFETLYIKQEDWETIAARPKSFKEVVSYWGNFIL